METFINYVKKNGSYSDVLLKCGYKSTSRKDIKKEISLLKLTTNHFNPYHKNKKEKKHYKIYLLLIAMCK
jgi:hypothetical protein